MSKSEFEKRIARIGKVPSAGAERVVHKAMLQQEIFEKRERREEQRSHDEDDPQGWVSWLWMLLLVSFLVLAGLFANDPAEAARIAVIMVPLMLLAIAVIFLHDARRHGPTSLFWDALIHGDFILKLLRMLR